MSDKNFRALRNAALAISLTLALSLLTCSCTPTKYVPMETVRTEYREADTTAIWNRALRFFEQIRQRESRSDSLIDHQKETVVLKENGDTARHDRERIIYRSSVREKELERTAQMQDSIIKALRLQLESVKSDTIPVPYPVEKGLTRWEQTKMDLGGFALGGLFVAVCIAVIWLVKKFRK